MGLQSRNSDSPDEVSVLGVRFFLSRMARKSMPASEVCVRFRVYGLGF